MHSTLAEKAYHRIREMLSKGELSPGKRLVNRTLADEIGVSFTPVREAINQLASEGLVEYVRGAGAYVRRVNRQELAQLFDLRANLEPFAAAEAARNISSDQISELLRHCERFYSLARSLRSTCPDRDPHKMWAEWLNVEEAFHGLLFRAAGNPWLLKVAAELRLMSMLFGPQRSSVGILTLSRAAWSWREHTRLVRLLASGEQELARSWMEQHIRTGRSHVMAWFDRQGSEALESEQGAGKKS